LARFSANESEAQKSEGLRLAELTPFAIDRRMAAEFDQVGLVTSLKKLRMSASNMKFTFVPAMPTINAYNASC